MKIRLSISTAITLFGLILAVGFASVVLTGAYALKELKVGGPLYASIKLGNDLVADILPPPAYVIEAYLEATLALREAKNPEPHEKKLVQLKKDYDDRKTFWTSSDLQPSLKALLVDKSDAEVRKFWQTLETELLPALHKGESEKAEAAYARLTEIYSAHRAVIDELVEKANKQNSDTEAVAAARDASMSYVVWSVSGLVLAVVVLGIFGLAFGVVRPLGRMTEAMKQIAKGNLETEVPFADRAGAGADGGNEAEGRAGHGRGRRARDRHLGRSRGGRIARRRERRAGPVGPCARSFLGGQGGCRRVRTGAGERANRVGRH